MTDSNQAPDPSTDDRPMPSTTGEPAQKAAHEFAVAAARLLADSHCDDVLVFDVRDISQITNFLVIATGTSDRQLKGVGKYVSDLAGEHHLDRFGTEQDDATKWLVLDFVDVMVHLFEPATRAHYDLEMLWGDAPQINWRRESS